MLAIYEKYIKARAVSMTASMLLQSIPDILEGSKDKAVKRQAKFILTEIYQLNILIEKRQNELRQKVDDELSGLLDF